MVLHLLHLMGQRNAKIERAVVIGSLAGDAHVFYVQHTIVMLMQANAQGKCLGIYVLIFMLMELQSHLNRHLSRTCH